MISASAITTLGVPEPTVIRKSGIFLPLALVRFSRYAMIRQTIIPRDAAQTAAIILFRPELKIDFRDVITCQYFKVRLPGSNRDLPIFTVKEVATTDANGITTTIIAKQLTRIVTGIRQRPRSTMFGRVDFPDTVMYSRFPITKLDMYRMISAIAIRNTARFVASVRPSWDPMYT